jgi:hypothetical protein
MFKTEVIYLCFCYNKVMDKSDIEEFVKSQKSLHLYKNIQEAFTDVLSNLSEEQFVNVKNNLIIMAFHEGVSGQVMHFDTRVSKFAVMQLYIPRDMPTDVLRWVIAHELGHVFQGRNSEGSDGMRLEDDATDFAEKIGYPKAQEISEWLAADNS